MCDLFGGPSAAENSTLAQQSGLSQTLLSNFNQTYAQQQGTLNQLQSQIQRIQSGQTGPGYGGAENAALISGIQNNAAAAGRNAIQAVRSVGAGSQSSPTGGMTRQSGINQQVAGQIEANVGAGEANALNAETVANYAQGRQNAVTTASALSTLANQYNPTAYSSQAGASLGAQFGQANTVNTQNQQRAQAIAGLIEKVGMGAATFGAGGLGAIGAGEGVGEGISDFFSGGANATFGTNFNVNGPSTGGGSSPGGWNPYSS